MSTVAAAPSLKALAESKTDGVTKAATFRVNPDLITFEPGFNLRTENDELDLHIDRLAAAMVGGAFIPPVDVSVKDGVIIARDGHCRTRAAQKVKLTVPDFTLECRQLRGSEADAVLHMLGTGSGQKALTPLEQGRGFLRLINMGFTSQQIADKLGVSRVTIDNNLTLAEAPLEVQNMVANGEVSGTMAREVVKQGPEAVQALKETVEAERKNPTPTASGKKSTKKKVTAKKLAGTAAAKKSSKKKGSKKAAAPAAPVLAEGETMVKVKKSDAQEVAEFLRANAPHDAQTLKDFAAALEMVLM